MLSSKHYSFWKKLTGFSNRTLNLFLLNSQTLLFKLMFSIKRVISQILFGKQVLKANRYPSLRIKTISWSII
jgi:hypothetical protein